MIGTSLGNRYELSGMLGRGGMGVVYRARDPMLHREVAVKVLPASVLTGQAEARFKREARVVARMDHPSIVPIYDVGEFCDGLYYVMPVITGDTLKGLVHGGCLALGTAVEIISQVAEALEYSHQRDVVHRDVKPENIMVAEEEGRLRVRVMDFGLAIESSTSRLTQTGGLPGTLAYLSPEQILGAEIDLRSDIYSLGTVLYECLAGQAPFKGSRYGVLYRIVHHPPPSLEARGVDLELEQIVLRCLSKDRDQRFARCADLVAALRGYGATLTDQQRSLVVAWRGEGPEGGTSSADGQPRRGPFVGRQRERAELRQRLDAMLAGECQLALVGGEAGMGKTRLLRELEAEARLRGARVLQGRFSDRENAFPFQGFGELIQDFFRHQTSTAAVEELQDLLPDLLLLFPALGEIAALRLASGGLPSWLAGEAGGDKTRIFELLARTLTRLAAGEPMVLLLENLHATEACIEAVQYLLRRLGPTPMLLVATFRHTELRQRHPLVGLMRSAKDDPRISCCVLGPLTPAESRELMEHLLGLQGEIGEGRVGGGLGEIAEKLHEATEGNPFFLQELLRSLIDSGGMSRDSTGIWWFSGESPLSVDSLPETIQQAVESRLERFSDAQLTVARTASVLGRSFDYHDLQSLLTQVAFDQGEVDEIVDQLILEAVLDEDRHARGDRLFFVSGVVREVLYGQLSRRRRRTLHRHHARSLERRYEDRLERIYPRLVHHFTAADMPVETIAYALLLGRGCVDTFGAETAVRAVRTALEFIEEEEVDRAVEGELRYLLASALATSGSIEGALQEATRGARILHEAGDDAGAAEAALVAAEAAWRVRKVGETQRWVEKGIQLSRQALVALEGVGHAGLMERSRQTLRQQLLLAATVSNLRGQYSRARTCQEEADAILLRVKQDDQEELPLGGTLVTTLPQPPTTLDPALMETVEDAELLANVYETLLRCDGDGHLTAGLCSSWEALPDGRGFQLTLDQRACFSNGQPVTAMHVRRSLEAAAHRGAYLPAVGGGLLGLGIFRRGAADSQLDSASPGQGIEVVDERVIRFHLGRCLPIFPAMLTDPRTAIVWEGSAEGGLAWAGSGPFCLVGQDAERVILERNEHYWKGRVTHLERLEMRTSLDASGIAAGLRMGELDLGRDLLPADLEGLLRDGRFRTGLVESTQKSTYFVSFNARGPLARHAAVRRALAGVVRTQDLVWRTLGRLAHPANCLIPPGLLGHDPSRRSPVLSREEARGLLRGAGLPDSLRLVAAIHPLFFDRYSSLLLALFAEWSALGIEVAIETTSMDDYLGRWANNDAIDLLIGRWLPDYDDPDNVVYALYHSQHGHLGGGQPDSSADVLIEKARHETRTSVRQALYRKVEGLLAEQGAVLPLFHATDYRLLGQRVCGFEFVASAPFVAYGDLAKRTRPARDQGMALGVRHESVVQMALPDVFDTLDPAWAKFMERAEVVPNVFETLTKVGESARIIPSLAAEYQVEDAARRFHFRLRSGVRFHDGRRLSSRDVRYTFERLLRLPRTGSEQPLASLRGARRFRDGSADQISGFRITSDTEFTLDLCQPLVVLPAMLTRQTLCIVPEGSTDFTGGWRDGCAGTGPFRVASFLPCERVELEAHTHYWRRGFPRCDQLVFNLGLDSQRLVDDFRAGSLSLAAYLRPNDVETLRREIGFSTRYQEVPGLSTYHLVFNCRRGPFADSRRRHALVQAFDMATITRATVGRLGIPANGLLPPGLPGHDPAHRGGRLRGPSSDLRNLEFKALVHPTYEDTHQAFWQLFLRTAEALGVRISSRFVTLDEMTDPALRHEADVTIGRWYADYPDSHAFVESLYRDGGLDGISCGGPELDRLIERGLTLSDSALRHANYRELEQFLAREALILPFFHQQIYRFHRPELEGLRLRFGYPEVLYEELSLGDE